MRVVIAFIVAPLIASVVFVALEHVPLWKFLQGWLLVSAGAGVLTVMFAVPIYVWLRRRHRLTFRVVVVSSVSIPVVPYILLFVYRIFSSNTGYYFFAKGHVLVEGGSYTLYGLWFHLVGSSQFAFCGLIAGICFWLIAHRKWGMERDNFGSTNRQT